MCMSYCCSDECEMDGQGTNVCLRKMKKEICGDKSHCIFKKLKKRIIQKLGNNVPKCVIERELQSLIVKTLQQEKTEKKMVNHTLGNIGNDNLYGDLPRKYIVSDNLCDVLEYPKQTTRYICEDIGIQEEYTHCDMMENDSVKTNFQGSIPIVYTGNNVEACTMSTEE